MTEQLRGKIAKEIGQHAENIPWADYAAYRSTDFILTLVKEALPELAKDAGYKSPEECAFLYNPLVLNYEEGVKRGSGTEHALMIERGFAEWAKDNGYAKLAENQRIPENPYALEDKKNQGKRTGYWRGQSEMLKAGWRKVEIKDGD